MTLAEKLRFLADRAEDEKEFLIEDNEHIFDENTLYTGGGWLGSVDINALKFAELKLKPQWEFTEDEKAILRNLPEQYNWIARDDDDEIMGELFVYAFKPSKFNNTWIFDKGSVTDLGNFKHLFQSVRWSDEEPCEFRKYL